MIVHERPEDNPIVLSSLWQYKKGKDTLTCPYCDFKYTPLTDHDVFAYCPNCGNDLRKNKALIELEEEAKQYKAFEKYIASIPILKKKGAKYE